MSARFIMGVEGRTLRYGATVLAGFAIDFATALLLTRLLAVPLPVSAAVGFTVALVFNYVLFELWVFGAGGSRLAALRLRRTAAAAGIALGVRVAAIWLIGRVLGSSLVETSAMLLVGASASLIVNYLIVRHVFVAHESARS